MSQENIQKPRKISFVKVKGNCMLPLLEEGSFVPYEPVSFSNLVKGDIVVLKFGSELLIHRLIDKINFCDKAFIVHKGDNSPLPLVISSESLIGRAVLESLNLSRGFRQTAALKFKLFIIRVKCMLKILI